jgi:hypothetical protein
VTGSDASTSATNYLGPFANSLSATESSVQLTVPVAGTLANLNVKIGTAAGSGNSYTFTIRKNASSQAAMSCKIEGTTPTACSSAGTAAFAAGDLLSLQVVPNSNPNNWGDAHWAVTLTP